MNWLMAKISDVCEIIMGQSPKSKYYNTEKKGLPFFQGKMEFGDVYPTPRKWCSKPLKIAKKNDILISVRAPVGPTNICQETSCIGRGLAAIRYLANDAHKFLFYYLRSIESKLANIGTGSTFSAISKSQISNLKIPLPPLPEQHRIVAKIEELFTRLDAGVEALKKIKTQLKRYRQAVLKYAFEGKLTQEWREANKDKLEPASILLERIKEERKAKLGKKYKELPPINTSELPELPEGWVWTWLGDVLNPSAEKINPKEITSMPYIGLEHIEKDTGKILGKGLSNSVRSIKNRFYAGDLLYGKLRPYLNKAYVPEFDGICSTDILVFSKIKNLSNKYMLYRILCDDFVRYSNQRVSGVQHPRVDFEKISEFQIQLPPLPEQHKIVEEIESRFSVADEIEKVVDQSLKQAERLRQSILKRAFEGKLVPQDPTDEPAEKLLERIKREKESQNSIKQKSKRRK